MAIPLALIALGAGVQAYGQYKSSQDAAWAARQNAKLKRAQATEMLEKMKIQEQRIHSQGEDFKAKQINEFAASGVQLGAGATLVALEDTNMKIGQQVDDMKRDTKFKANQIMLGAGYEDMQAAQTSNAGKVAAFGSLLEGGASAYKNS
jgi:superfamily II RNA helicase